MISHGQKQETLPATPEKSSGRRISNVVKRKLIAAVKKLSEHEQAILLLQAEKESIDVDPLIAAALAESRNGRHVNPNQE